MACLEAGFGHVLHNLCHRGLGLEWLPVFSETVATCLWLVMFIIDGVSEVLMTLLVVSGRVSS